MPPLPTIPTLLTAFPFLSAVAHQWATDDTIVCRAIITAYRHRAQLPDLRYSSCCTFSRDEFVVLLSHSVFNSFGETQDAPEHRCCRSQAILAVHRAWRLDRAIDTTGYRGAFLVHAWCCPGRRATYGAGVSWRH